MRILVLALFSIQLLASDLPIGTFKTLVRFEDAPTDVDITKPYSMTYDQDGTIYVFDVVSGKILSWDKKGTYLSSFGGLGKGPGEFDLKEWGIIASNDEYLFVYDERKVHFFSHLGKFIRSVPTSGKGFSRWTDLEPWGDKFIVSDMNHRLEGTRLMVLDQEFNIVNQIGWVEGAPFQKNENGGWNFNPGSNEMVTSLSGKEIWFGNKNDNLVKQVDLNGKTLREFRVPVIQQDLLDSEVDYYREAFKKWAKPNDRFTMTGKRPYFEFILPIAGDLFLMAEFRGDEGVCKGIAIDKTTGKAKARSAQVLSKELAFFMPYYGNLLFVAADEDGIYHLSTAKFVMEEPKNESKEQD